jgi:pimeloyl-ACP methyl ester carboxylesterase
MTRPPELPGVTHRFVDLATGVRAHVAEAGDPGAPAILALHGWPQHWWLWRDVIGPLAASHRVLAPDTRGFGWSAPAPDGDYRKDRLVEDALALLDAEGIASAHVIGHDWGGFTGFLAARRAPERVRSLLACNIVPPWVSPARVLPHAWRFAYQVVVGAPVLGPALARDGRAIRAVLGSAMSDADAEVFVERLRRPEQAQASAALYRQFLLREAGSRAFAGGSAALPMPVKILFGTGDPALRPGMLEGQPYDIELVPGVGHFIVDERPDLVADRALAFFS